MRALDEPDRVSREAKNKRELSALPGMMIRQDGSTHQWVPGKYWNLIVTLDDATNEHYSMRFVDEEGTHSSFLGVKDIRLVLLVIHR